MNPASLREPRSHTEAAEKRQKYFVNRKEMVTIRCRSCGRDRTLAVGHLKEKAHFLHIDCPCTRSFEVVLEFRQDYRTKSHIAGSFRALSTPKARARQCVIADHSSGGLLLAITDEVPIQKGDRLIVSYRPDNDAPEEIERLISIRHYQQGKRIGGAFIEADPEKIIAAPAAMH